MQRFLGLMILVALLIPASMTASGQSDIPPNLLIHLAPEPPRPGVISTRNQTQQLRVQDGQTVRLAKASGRDYRLQSGGAFVWTQVQQVNTNESSITLTPQVLEDGRIQVAMEVFNRQGDRQNAYQSTLLVADGKWIQLYGDSSSSRSGAKSYSTRKSSDDSLYLMAEILR